nr:hypothetical protein CFP56_13199 [Quercus suber]
MMSSKPTSLYSGEQAVLIARRAMWTERYRRGDSVIARERGRYLRFTDLEARGSMTGARGRREQGRDEHMEGEERADLFVGGEIRLSVTALLSG